MIYCKYCKGFDKCADCLLVEMDESLERSMKKIDKLQNDLYDFSGNVYKPVKFVTPEERRKSFKVISGGKNENN